MPIDYTTCTIADMEVEFAAIAREARDVLGALDERQLNWKADPSRWSVAQCLDHLLTIDRPMLDGMEAALDPARPKPLVARLGLLAGFFGQTMVRSLGPQVTRKFKAPKASAPSTSALDATIVSRFIAHQAECATRLRALGAKNPERVIMRSPFAPISYSVLDACRITCAHERRHFEQARRVTETPGFPAHA